jgi:hypothetical protein
MCAPAKQTAVHKTKTLMVRAAMTKMSAPSKQRQPMAAPWIAGERGRLARGVTRLAGHFEEVF